MREAESWISELPRGAKIAAANAGDHGLILQLLVQTLQTSIEEDFQSRLDDPAYRPSDRLVVRMEDRLTSHVHVSHHVGMFDGERIPLVWFENFVTLPEYEQSGHDEALMETAESTAAREGAILAVTRTNRTELLRGRGWSPLLSQGRTRASVSAILAHLDAQEATRRRRKRSRIEVRTWRHFELDYVRQLYELCSQAMWGPLCRSESCWQWLIGRKSYDQILLAIDRLANVDTAPAGGAVGYAIVRDSCVVEMFTLPGFGAVAAQLLCCACRDAIDRDHHFVSLHCPADASLHELMVTAGGTWISDGADGSERWMVKLLSPHRWVERIYPLLHQLARQSNVARPFKFRFEVDGLEYTLTLTRRSARLEQAKSAGRPCAPCAWHDVQDLLLGNRTASHPLIETAAAVDAGAAEELGALLPPRLFWQSPLELIRR